LNKEKNRNLLHRPIVAFTIIVFLICIFVAWLVFSPYDCTWSETKIPQAPHVPENTTLISSGEIVRRGYQKSLSNEYVVENSTPEELVTFFENEHGVNCRVINTNSIYAQCSGTNNNIGEYHINIDELDNEDHASLLLCWYGEYVPLIIDSIWSPG